MKTFEIRIAVLKEQQIEEYTKLHNNIPDAIVKQLTDEGFSNVRIYRNGITLIMYVEHDEVKRIQDRLPNVELEERWRRVTESCFSTSWQVMPEIFNIQDHVSKLEGDGMNK